MTVLETFELCLAEYTNAIEEIKNLTPGQQYSTLKRLGMQYGVCHFLAKLNNHLIEDVPDRVYEIIEVEAGDGMLWEETPARALFGFESKTNPDAILGTLEKRKAILLKIVTNLKSHESHT